MIVSRASFLCVNHSDAINKVRKRQTLHLDGDCIVCYFLTIEIALLECIPLSCYNALQESVGGDFLLFYEMLTMS